MSSVKNSPIYPVAAIKGERREVDGCVRVVRIKYAMSDGSAVWVDHEKLLDEGNWADV